MKNKIVKKLTSLAAALALCVGLTGCQTGGEDSLGVDAQNGAQQEQQTGVPSANESGDVLSMGRYVEKQADLDQGVEGHSYMVRDGKSIKVFAYGATLYSSEDNGDSWSGTELDWHKKFSEENYIMESAFTNDGTFVIEYSPLSKREDTVKEGMAGDMEVDSDDGSSLNPHLMIISPDGTQQEIPVEFSADDMWARTLHFTQDNRLLGATFGKGLYEIDIQTGALNKLCTIEDNAMYVDSQENLLMIATYGGILIYDMESERFIEDDVLADFVKDTYSEPIDYGNCYNLYSFFGEENVIYIAGDKGLHRHVIGGSAVEQVIDASLS
ncbi:MAG: hypothetical protein K2N89_01455, partial [Lachnospiraceae bacterium]|nr:hypothetical protein [Lachnospiraceae bacterium]